MTFFVALNSRVTVFCCANVKGKFDELWSEIQGILLLTLHTCTILTRIFI